MQKIWFRRKTYGWGWYPCSWEGWLVIFVWAIFFTFGMVKMDHEWLKNLIAIFLSIGVLIYICYKKGEKPRWQWGKNVINDTAYFIVDSLLKQQKLGKKVLFFVTGGSSIAVALKIAEILKGQSFPNLTVMLTDERYGVLNHGDSNWYKLIQQGFNISGAKMIPVLDGSDEENTIKNFNENLEKEFNSAEYKIGLFGVGADGHTAGILPDSIAVDSKDLACGYDTQLFSRITITFKTIEKLDEAIIFLQGESKKEILLDLKDKDIDLKKQPAQILKKVPLLTIFTNLKI